MCERAVRGKGDKVYDLLQEASGASPRPLALWRRRAQCTHALECMVLDKRSLTWSKVVARAKDFCALPRRTWRIRRCGMH